MNAVLVVDKPAGFSSHDVVNRVRHITGERSVGHIGTLDPMATGVLPLLLGRYTRLAQFYTGTAKKYEGQIRFGFATDTYDTAGEPAGPLVGCELDLGKVRDAASSFCGVIEQNPPPFSAKKLAGVPAYRLARCKQEVRLAPVRVEVREFEIVAVEGDLASFRASVGPGTYLRSIAHELGQKLGVGGHLASLRRTAVGEFGVNEARTLDHVAAALKQCPITDIMFSNTVASVFAHPRTILPAMPAITAPEEALPRLLNGNAVNLPDFSTASFVKVFRGESDLLAVARRVAGTLFHPCVVLGAPMARAVATDQTV